MKEETKKKISESLQGRQYVKHYCKVCGTELPFKSKKHVCSNECKRINSVIPTLCKYFTYDPKYLGHADAITEYNRVREMLIDDYWNNNMNGREIAEKYNYPSYCNITGKLFKHLNINVRSCKETNKLNMLNGNKPISITPTVYKAGWHTTWENREVYLRSSYEFKYAKKLDSEHISYDVECLRIKYYDSQLKEYRCAIPDFYIFDSNTIVEIKSVWTLNIQEMKDKFEAYKQNGYNCILIYEHNQVDLYSL